MKTFFVDDSLTLEFEGAEKELLILALCETRNNYEIAYDDLPESLQKFWDGTLSHQNATELSDAAQDLKEARLAWRSERLSVLEEWLAPDGSLIGDKRNFFTLDREEIDLFLAILNDRRLTLAAAHGIDDAQMDTHPAAVPPSELQRILWEIHFLAFVMEHCLQAIQEEE